jgi:proline iminopeptidase
MPSTSTRLVDIGDTELFIAERGQGHPLIVLHGGPGLDHHMFGDYLDPLADECRLILVDQRANGRSGRPPEATWTLDQNAADVSLLAAALGLQDYAVLGHSYGAFVALQHAVAFPGAAAQTIISCGVPSGRLLLSHVEHELANFEPLFLREQVTQSWAKEQEARTPEDVAALIAEQLPFHFADPLDPRIADFARRTAEMVFAPEVLRKAASAAYGSIEVESRLGEIPQALLVLAGRRDRTCSVEAAEVIAAGAPNSELCIFEHSGHMCFAEETERYLDTVRSFLRRHRR